MRVFLWTTLAAGSYASLFHVGAYDTSNDRLDVDNGDASAVGPIAFTAAASEYAGALGYTDVDTVSRPQSAEHRRSGKRLRQRHVYDNAIENAIARLHGRRLGSRYLVAVDGNASLPIAPIAVGGTSPACTIVVSDAYGQTQSVTVTVTRTHGTIQ